jgi:hypothetical protein
MEQAGFKYAAAIEFVTGRHTGTNFEGQHFGFGHQTEQRSTKSAPHLGAPCFDPKGSPA